MRAGAFGERLDDLDRVDVVGQVREIGRLVAGAGADLEHLLALLGVDVQVMRPTICGPEIVTPKPMSRKAWS